MKRRRIFQIFITVLGCAFIILGAGSCLGNHTGVIRFKQYFILFNVQHRYTFVSVVRFSFPQTVGGVSKDDGDLGRWEIKGSGPNPAFVHIGLNIEPYTDYWIPKVNAPWTIFRRFPAKDGGLGSLQMRISGLGFFYSKGDDWGGISAPIYYDDGSQSWQIQIAFWVWVLVGLLLLTPGVRRWIARHRYRLAVIRGLCPNCHYDLRSSHDRCPECGTPIAARIGKQ